MKRNPRQDLTVLADALEQLHGTDAKQTMERLTLHLRRAIQCADLDTLAPPTLMLDAIRCQVEQAHAKRALGGIRRLREAIDGLEILLDRLPLARPGAVPVPCLALDIPAGGLVDRVLQGKRCMRGHAGRKRICAQPRPARPVSHAVKEQRKAA